MRWKRVLAAIVVAGFSLTVLAYVAYVSNSAPVVAPIAERSRGLPYVVKLHAQWCPVCMVTKGVWSQIETTYRGRVHMVVFDFTNDTTTSSSRAEAKRLSLEKYFDEHSGWTGTISVLDAQGSVLESIHGNRDFAAYQMVLDKALE
jgi:thiol-disulfide isomerase/thioredoxin